MQAAVKILAVALGGALGVNARYWIGVWCARMFGMPAPWATFLVNVSGSFAIGFLAALLASASPHATIRLFLITGLLGGYTTFSTFTHDSVILWQRDQAALSLANLFGSIIVGCAAVVLGAFLAFQIAPPAPRPAPGTTTTATTVTTPLSETIGDEEFDL